MSLIKSSFPLWPTTSGFFDDDWMKFKFTNGEWSPAINVVDNEDNFEIEVAAPGFEKKDFSVKVENGMLVISGKTEKEEEEKDKNYTLKEFSAKSFTRTFTLPENVVLDDIVAKYKDGMLRLMLKKSEMEIKKVKEIAIK